MLYFCNPQLIRSKKHADTEDLFVLRSQRADVSMISWGT
nr:MAG TPA: hypothetical protein [Caudoviricetes sp.]